MRSCFPPKGLRHTDSGWRGRQGFPTVGVEDRLRRHKPGRRTMAHGADHLSVSALEQQYRSCPDVTAARHVQTIWLLAKGHHIAEVSATVSFARRWVERLLARYNAQGPQALGDLRRRNGRSPSVLKPGLLSKAERGELALLLPA